MTALYFARWAFLLALVLVAGAFVWLAVRDRFRP
jgi:hypothetical protein